MEPWLPSSTFWPSLSNQDRTWVRVGWRGTCNVAANPSALALRGSRQSAATASSNTRGRQVTATTTQSERKTSHARATRMNASAETAGTRCGLPAAASAACVSIQTRDDSSTVAWKRAASRDGSGLRTPMTVRCRPMPSTYPCAPWSTTGVDAAHARRWRMERRLRQPQSLVISTAHRGWAPASEARCRSKLACWSHGAATLTGSPEVMFTRTRNLPIGWLAP